MKETVEMVVKALVDDVDAVDVREVDQQGKTLIEVRVAPGDMGKLIGRQGRTIKALRSLAHAVSLKKKQRFLLEIVE
ncbi:MAG TPA: KH domain-containing protein [Pyrinomonadaceae bacterium]|nr:KH domain-containing protein [Pyrinomonadaceae bacterium]